VITESGEFRLQQAIETTWSSQLQIPIHILRDDRFFCSKNEFRNGVLLPKPYAWNFSTES
jgi:deoxyribodipyrimidine photolyase-related protein